MRKMTVGLMIVLIAVMVCPPPAPAEFVRVKGLFWDSTMAGDIQASVPGLTGNRLGIKDTLGIKDSIFIPEVEFKGKLLGKNKLIVSYGFGDFTGKKTITQDLNFGGKTYSASDTLDTSFKVTRAAVLYEWLFAPETLTRMFPSITEGEFGLLLGVKYLGIDASVESTVAGTSVSESANLPIPVIGFFTQMGFLNNTAQVEFAIEIFDLNTSKAKVNYADFYVEGKAVIYSVPVSLGYMMSNFIVDTGASDTFKTDLNFKGFYIAASMGF